MRVPGAKVAHVRPCRAGYVRYNKRVLAQIEKNALLVTSRQADGARWHFLSSGRSNTIGVELRVLDALDKNDVKYTIHLPSGG